MAYWYALRRRWSLTPPFHHCLCTRQRQFVSVALIRQVAPSRGFPGAVPYGVRTFLDLGLRSGPRPPGQPEDKGIIPSMKRRMNLDGKHAAHQEHNGYKWERNKINSFLLLSCLSSS